MRLLERRYRLLDRLPWWTKLTVVNLCACGILYGVVGYFTLRGLPVGPAEVRRLASAGILAAVGVGWYCAYGWARNAPKRGEGRDVQNQIRTLAASLSHMDGRFIPTSGGQALAVQRVKRGIWMVGLVSSGALASADNGITIHTRGYMVYRQWGSTICFSFRTDVVFVRHDSGSALMMRPLLDRQRAHGLSYRQMGLLLAASDYNEPSELASLAAQLRTAANACRTQAPDLSGAFAYYVLAGGCRCQLGPRRMRIGLELLGFGAGHYVQSTTTDCRNTHKQAEPAKPTRKYECILSVITYA